MEQISIKNSRSLCWIDEENLLIFRRNSFYIYSIATKKASIVCKMEMTSIYRLFSMFRIFRRLFRLYPNSVAFDKKTSILFFTFKGFVYSLDLKSNILKKEIKLQHESSRALSICLCENGQIFLGEYPTRYDGKPVCILERTEPSNWRTVYEFDAGTIRHIHLLKENDGNLYCFTGDEDDETKILCFKDKRFDSVPETIACGNQKYRACFSFFKSGKLFYLTDSPYLENTIFSLDLETKVLESLFHVGGSVIYGLEDGHNIWFSTAVENNLKKDSKGKNVKIKIDGFNGGIRSNKACLYSFDLTTGKLKKVLESKKDFLPKKFFGFGTYTFTCNSNKKYISFSTSGVKNDETVIIAEKKQ